MKERLDVLLVAEGFFETTEKAKRSIMAGNVIVNEKKIDKSGTMIKVTDDLSIRVKGHTCPYVSRGGYKLEKAIKSFNIDFKGKTVLDVGSSTGGFTDCALQNGADYVYAVDVGTNQLDYKLRNSIKVKSLENMHIKNLTQDDVDRSQIDVIVMDVSFISIKKIIPDLIKFFNENTILMALIKPQFEVEKDGICKGGIVKDQEQHLKVIREIISFVEEAKLNIEHIDFSPIKGGKGNVEYISLITMKNDKRREYSEEELRSIIKEGETLGGEI
ncbi:MAG: TlyA family RNA methyltransferase [Fusobacteriaceae bacterium]